jgi:predicted LPLAT superfamily acyltransferase
MNQSSSTQAAWQQRREGGSTLGLRLIRWVALHVSARIARASLYPITLYFLITRGSERRASRAYLQRVFKRTPGLLLVARHIHTFATTILDRVFLLTDRFDSARVRVHGLPVLRRHLDAGRGVLLMGSHFGSFEAVRAIGLARDELAVRILMDYQHNAQLSTIIDALNPRAKDSIIDAGGESTRVLLQIHETLAAGGLVGILADRARAGEHTLECLLLDAPVALPSSPFRLAAVLRQPVMLIFGVLRPDNTYDVYFEEFADEITLGLRSERERALHQWMRKYALRLEQHMVDAPYNWFNFYEFWLHETSDPA